MSSEVTALLRTLRRLAVVTAPLWTLWLVTVVTAMLRTLRTFNRHYGCSSENVVQNSTSNN
ncbi:hypothetical protein V1477_000172 [Vespula maculifrons]|uniref:Uncharacterized protein n=1 Tax=Vespula maculifrons TaxID=7453 RepID=A0ABD2D2I6_VESMC